MTAYAVYYHHWDAVEIIGVYTQSAIAKAAAARDWNDRPHPQGMRWGEFHRDDWSSGRREWSNGLYCVVECQFHE